MSVTDFIQSARTLGPTIAFSSNGSHWIGIKTTKNDDAITELFTHCVSNAKPYVLCVPSETANNQQAVSLPVGTPFVDITAIVLDASGKRVRKHTWTVATMPREQYERTRKPTFEEL